MRNKKIGFYKLMGSSKQGTFRMSPDLRQWPILIVNKTAITGVDKPENFLKYWLGSFISVYTRFFQCKTSCFVLEPVEGHGRWNNKEIFGPLPKRSAYEGEIASLTRASIRLKNLLSFQKKIPAIEAQLQDVQGLKYALGIGEMPFLSQVTFSIWESREQLQTFAYKGRAHAAAIKSTKDGNWFKEELFVRFRVVRIFEAGL